MDLFETNIDGTLISSVRVRVAHLVMVQQLRNVPGHEDPGVVAVEAEPVSLLLYPGVETPAVPPEADTEQVLVLGRVPQQKTALWPLVQ